MAAVDRDQQQTVAANAVIRIRVFVAQEVRVADLQGGQVACANPEDRRARGDAHQRTEAGARCIAIDPPQSFARGEDERPDRIRTVGPAEMALRAVRRQPVAARRLLVAEPLWQFLSVFDFAVDQRTLIDARPNHAKPGMPDQFNQFGQSHAGEITWWFCHECSHPDVWLSILSSPDCTRTFFHSWSRIAAAPDKPSDRQVGRSCAKLDRQRRTACV